MNRNRKLRKQMMSGLAVGMAAVMGAAPVYAATGEDAAVSKEETVYVNANADGSEDQITVSNWLKNAGTEKNLQDESELKDIKNVKGDEEWKNRDIKRHGDRPHICGRPRGGKTAGVPEYSCMACILLERERKPGGGGLCL